MRLSLTITAVLVTWTAFGQEPAPPEPTPAFAGQTDAPPPKDKSRYRVTVITDKLAAPWAIAFLPDGNLLVSEFAGRLRTVSPSGAMSEPIAGVPPSKIVAAQGFHDVALDPDFATNRYVYFTYFAPPKGEEPKRWPLEHFYNEVWEKSLAERRVLDLGFERVGRGKLSADERRLEDVEVLIDGRAERRLVFAPDKTLFVTGADAFRFYDSDLDGVEHDFTAEPDIRRNFSAASSASTATARHRRTTRGSAARRCHASFTHMAFAIPRARRSIPRRASSGSSSTARKAATS